MRTTTVRRTRTSILLILPTVTRMSTLLILFAVPWLAYWHWNMKEIPNHLVKEYGASSNQDGGDEIQNWESGIEYEVNFHSKWIREEVATEGWFDYERKTKLKGLPVDIHQKFICQLFSSVYGSGAKDKVKVMLDHGAGPFTNLGNRFNCDYEEAPTNVKHVEAQVVAVDPLAPMYHGILSKEKVFNTLRTMYCPSENLTKCLGYNSFDFAIIINALDHSKSPFSAFLESLMTVRIGGISCVYTMIDEASQMNGAGFHQWNFRLNASRMWLIENHQTKAKKVVDSSIESFAKRLATPDPSDSNQLFICYQKTGEVINAHT